MRKETHDEVVKEVLDEVEQALKDRNGLLFHQRRLAFSLSLGAENFLELHFHNLNIMKEGSKIDHRWFKKNKKNILEQLQKQIISPIESVENIKQIIELISEIEHKRDDLAYGAPSTEKILQEKINLFFKLKKLLKC